MSISKLVLGLVVLVTGLFANLSVLAFEGDTYNWASESLYIDYIEDYFKDNNPDESWNIPSENKGNRIHFLPVLGDAILLESNGLFALIDGGEDSDNPKGLSALDYPGYEQLVIDYIKSVAGDENGKVTLEFVIGTHAHSDHLGGLDSVILDPDIEVKRGYLKRYNEERISDFEVMNWDNQEVYNQTIAALEEVGAEIIQDLTMEPFSLGEMVIQLFNVEQDETFPVVKKGENENSLGIKVTVGNYSAFLAGDMNNADGDEDRLAPLIGEVTLLKLGHHGLSGSSSSYFLNTLRPIYSIVTGYTKNFFSETRQMLESLGTKSYSTMSNNGIVFDFNLTDFESYNYKEILIGWYEKDGNKNYYTTNGDMVKGWSQIEDNWYFFDEGTGVMQVGWLEHKGHKYYLDESGIMVTDWLEDRGQKYYFNQSGMMVKGWLKEDDYWYYLKPDGTMATGWLNDGNKTYYLKSDGVMATGWQKLNDKWYYFYESGPKATGWLEIGTTWYFLNTDGVMQTGWLKDRNKWYYLKSSGEMATGWQKVNGVWYYLYESGSMATGWLKEGNTWYYLKPSGEMVTGWKMINGTWYYFYQSGKMAANTIIDGWQVTASGAAYKL